MLIQREIKVHEVNVKFNFKFKNDFTLIAGNSGTGKTLFYNLIRMQYNLLKSLNEEKNKMYFLNRDYIDYLIMPTDEDSQTEIESAKSSLCEKLKKVSNTICIIDEADYILNDEAIEYINSDINNQYIVFSRDTEKFNVSYDNVAEIASKADRELILFYPYIDGGEQCG